MANEPNQRIERDIVEEMRKMNEQWEKDKQTGKQLGFGLVTDTAPEEDLEGLDFLRDTQNPDRAWDYYYAIRRELMNNLPPGGKHKRLRNFIYEEKNIFLRRGKQNLGGTIGADSRQAFLHHSKIALESVRRWSADGGSPIEIFFKFYDLNREAGHRPKFKGRPPLSEGKFEDVSRAAVGTTRMRNNKLS